MDSRAKTSDDHIFCKCPHCMGQFTIAPGMLESKLLCPHCREQIDRPEETVLETASPKDESRINLPAPKKEKFTPTRRSAPSAPKELSKDSVKFEDKVPEFVAVNPEIEYDKTRLKRYADKEKGGLLNFFLILGALAMLTIAGVLYYLTVNLPDVGDPKAAAEDLLVDHEGKESTFYQSAYEIPEEMLDTESGIYSGEEDPILKLVRGEVFQPGDLDSALQTIKQYCAGESVDERIKHVYAPEETLGPMKVDSARHAPGATGGPKPVQISNARLVGKVMVTNIVFDDNSMKSANFLQEEGGSRWLLEWFSWSQYQEMTYGELMEKRPRKPVTVRVYVGMAANYERPFESAGKETNYERKSYINVDVRFDDTHSLRGYADRHEQLSADLTRELLMGNIPVTVSIQFPDRKSEAKPDQVIITKLVRTGWLGDKAYRFAQENLESE